eukprot:2767858-Rhodomonas_salina.1
MALAGMSPHVMSPHGMPRGRHPMDPGCGVGLCALYVLTTSQASDAPWYTALSAYDRTARCLVLTLRMALPGGDMQAMPRGQVAYGLSCYARPTRWT